MDLSSGCGRASSAIDAGEYAVFMDWLSLPQKSFRRRPGADDDDFGEHTREERAAFRYALERMSVLYCHQQTAVAVLMQPGKDQLFDIATAITGLKPLVETWRVLTGAPKPPDHTIPPEWMLALSRTVEVLLESLPQAVLQAYIYIRTDEPTTLQRMSLFGSVAAAGYILAMAH